MPRSLRIIFSHDSSVVLGGYMTPTMLAGHQGHPIAASIEGLTEGMEEEIQRLPIGSAIITGGGVSMPLFVEIRPRESKHGGESVEVIPARRM